MTRPENVYKENPYLVFFDAAQELGIFDFFEEKSKQEKEQEKNGFFKVDAIYKGCRNIPPIYKRKECPTERNCPFKDKDSETQRTPCEDVFNKNYPFINCPFKESSLQAFYFLMICLSSEMEFFEKKGRYFRKKYQGTARQSTEYEMLESGIYNHLFDLKNFLDFSESYNYFFKFKDRLIIKPHHENNRSTYSDELFFNKVKITFLKGMAEIAYKLLPEFLSITDFSKCRTLLDIGPGACVYSMGIFEKLQGLHAKKENSEGIKIFELDSPAVDSWYSGEDFGTFVKDKLKPLNIDKFKEKFTFVPIVFKPGEFKKDDLFSKVTWNQDSLKNKKFDVILIQNILNQNSKIHAKRLLGKCYEKINFGGKIIIQDYFKDISESEPFGAVVDAIYLRSVSNTGQTYTNFELSFMLFECGFRNIKQQRVSTFSSIIEAEKIVPIAKDEILQRFWRHMFVINHQKKEQKSYPLDFEGIYAVDVLSLLKKAIIEYRKDALEIELEEENPERENYIRIFGEESDGFQKKGIFEKLVQDIKNKITSCVDKLEKWLQKNGNGYEGIGEMDAETIKDCWKFLFHLNLLDKDVISDYPHDWKAREIKKKMYVKNKQLLIKLLQSKMCPDHLIVFILLLIFKEFTDLDVEEITNVVTHIAQLEEPYSVVRHLQKYFGPNQEACKLNLLHSIVRCDKINDPRAFIYLWTLRWFLVYEFVNRDDFEFSLLVEEFSESKYPFIQKEVEKIGELLGVKDDQTH
jgi:hypothetical protein